MATIQHYVTRELIGLDAAAPCADAARIMSERNIGAVAVLDGAEVIGLLTERDLVTRVLAGGASARLPLRAAMRTDVPTVQPDASEAECTTLMRDHGTRHLLVTEDGRTVGIISMRDLIRLMLSEKEWLIDQLQSFIDGRDRPRAAAS